MGSAQAPGSLSVGLFAFAGFSSRRNGRCGIVRDADAVASVLLGLVERRVRLRDELIGAGGVVGLERRDADRHGDAFLAAEQRRGSLVELLADTAGGQGGFFARRLREQQNELIPAVARRDVHA